MQNQDLIQKLQNCIAQCLHCADACLDEPDIKKMVPCIRLDKECAAVCEASVKMLVQKSTYDKKIVALCAQVCRDCEKECRKHDSDHCQQCADACQACAKACESYA